MKRSAFRPRGLFLAFAALAASAHAADPAPTFAPFDASGIYDIGEKVGWTVTFLVFARTRRRIVHYL